MASFGENLRRERELRGIELRDIAEATKISMRFLQALEQDRVDILPGGIFRRAFVRQYARFVGLDAERVVAEFLFAHEVEGEPEPAPPAQNPPLRRRGGPLAVVVLLGAGLLGLTFVGRRDEPIEETAVAEPVAGSAPETIDRVYPPPVSEPEAPVQGLVLTLSARQSCWVAADVDGESVLNRVMNQGETETLEATGEIVLSVGNAGGLSFSVNDRPGVPLGRSGEVRRNIIITRQSLPSLVRDSPSADGSHSS